MYDLTKFGTKLRGFGITECSSCGVMYSDRPIDVVERYEYQLVFELCEDCSGGVSWDLTSCRYRSRARVESWDVVMIWRSGIR